ncbi:hypothetical protein BDZ85DRAFT_68294 [Elsinoe ampelina]|uniref:RING-type domain-containing protein n=1 Tax=Elsinoe ampelina TaxID=302913 RepID=A0A6A6GIW5_9PEZI|nr:hypothetical protein BDZ85DRAFT_68294 [Elsinoe ampelina]
MVVLLSLLSLLSFVGGALAQFEVQQSQRNLTAGDWSLSWTAGPNSNASASLYALGGQRSLEGGASNTQVSLLTSYGATSNTNIINGSSVAFISCDPEDYPRPGNVGPAMVYIMAVQRNAAAVILYSNIAPSCDIIGPDTSVPSYDRVWTLLSPADSQRIQSDERSAPSPVLASVGRSPIVIDYNAFGNLTTPGAVIQQQTPPPQRSQNMNTQVAMIILYTVTGVVTALFLVIITTGAIRAHRHPERYGPRNIMGRPRQTRARGLARAMLDSLPIVKFSDPDSPKPDQTSRDAELGETNRTLRSDSEPTLKDGITPAANTATTTPVARTTEDTASIRSGIGPAVDAHASNPNATTGLGLVPHPGCSICTEDFEDGQDLRVLPCDHKFHPACVDPWLLNVSGTCPLCRIDLRRNSQDSNRDGTEGQGEADGQLPPPLEMASPTPGQVGQGRELERTYRMPARRSFFGGVFGEHEGHSQEISDMLRRWRDEARGSRSGVAAMHGDRGGSVDLGAQERDRRNRFSRVFGIRTRREGRDAGVTAAQGSGVAQTAQQGGDAQVGGVDGARQEMVQVQNATVQNASAGERSVEAEAALDTTAAVDTRTEQEASTAQHGASRPATPQSGTAQAAATQSDPAQTRPTKTGAEQSATTPTKDKQ